MISLLDLSNDELVAEFLLVSVNDIEEQNRFTLEMTKRQLKGLITGDQVQSAWRLKYLDEWTALQALWARGELFNCQWWDFSSFLQAATSEKAHDEGRFKNIDRVAALIGELESELMKEIREMKAIRIDPTLSSRRVFCNSEGAIMSLTELSKVRGDEFCVWRDAYHASAKRRGWKGGHPG